MLEEDSLHLSGFLDDLGIVDDLLPSSMDPDFATFNDMELSPIEDHARSLDMYYVPRTKVGPQDRNRNRFNKDKILRQDRALNEPQTETMDIVSQFQHFGNFSSNSDSSSGNQEESPRKAARIEHVDSFGSMLSHLAEDGPAPLGSNPQWPLEDRPFGGEALTPAVPTLNLNLVNSNAKSEVESLPFVGEQPTSVTQPRPNGSSVAHHPPLVRNIKPVPSPIPEGRALNNMLSTFGADQPSKVEISRALEKQRRKRRHALTERSRTRSLSAKIKELGEKLNAAGVTCKMEKLPILTMAVEYVYTMQASVNEKMQTQIQLNAKIAMMQEKIAALKALNAIRSGSRVYRQVHPQKPYPTVIIDGQYKIVDCSDNFLSMINVSKSQALDPGTLLTKCPELDQIFPYCQKILGSTIENDNRDRKSVV